MANEIKGLVNITTGVEIDDATDTIDTEVSTQMLAAYSAYFKDGLDLSYSDDHTIGISIGSAFDSTAAVRMALSSAWTKDFSSAWASGTGNGLFPSTVSRGTSTHYHVFELSDGAGTTDFCVDEEIDCSDALTDSNIVAAGLTYFRRIGSIWSTSGDNTKIDKFFQFKDWVYHDVPVEDLNTGGGGIGDTTAHLLAIKAPADVVTEVLLIVGFYAQHGGTEEEVYISSPDCSDVAAADAASSAMTTYYVKQQTTVIAIPNAGTGVSEVRYRGTYASSVLIIGTLAYREFWGRAS